jgi:formylglycine-generating enzyme required for sulfatase activity
LLGGTPVPANADQIMRNPGARVFLPSNDEWHKAALYEPAHGYWFYGTRSDVLPTEATADVDGNVSNPGANVANYNFSADWNGLNGNVTTVGSCGAASASYYGLDDATGNIAEWCQDRDLSQSILLRMIRGGAFSDGPFEIFDGEVASATPSIELNAFGFRLASAVPEPASVFEPCAAAAGLIARRRRR